MGSNITCHNCCVEREYNASIKSLYTPGNNDIKGKATHPDLMQTLITFPDPSYARPVSNVIDLTGTVRRTYREQKQPQKLRASDLRGTVLQSFYLFNWNAYYDGEWKDGLPHGQGRLHYDCGSLYEGTLNHGVIEADMGLYIFADGSYYKGAFRHDKAHGQGTYKSENLMYAGEWSSSIPHGKGKEVTKDSQYEGEFFFGRKHGKGKMMWSTDCIQYVGSFANNELEGRGVLQTKTSTYEGSMHQSKKGGFGKLTYKNGNCYQGNFIQDQREGDGIFTWQSGSKFIGKFHKDRQHGYGILTMPDGTVLEGNWVDGEFEEDNQEKEKEQKQNRVSDNIAAEEQGLKGHLISEKV